jgi:small subunit ribosomal protein S5
MSKQKRGHKMREVMDKKEFDEEVLQVDRVTRVVKGGRRLRFRATVIIGNKKGKVGIGLGKSVEVAGAIKKAVAEAKKHLITVPIVNDTVPFEVHQKFKAAKIMLRPAQVGKGIIAGSATRRILELAGVNNIVAKSFGSTNKINVAKATIDALLQYQTKEIRYPKKKKAEAADAPKKEHNKPQVEKNEKSEAPQA